MAACIFLLNALGKEILTQTSSRETHGSSGGATEMHTEWGNI